MTLPCIRDLLPIICSGRARRTGGPSSLTVGAKGDTVPPIRPSGPRPGSGGTLKSLPDSSKIIMQGGLRLRPASGFGMVCSLAALLALQAHDFPALLCQIPVSGCFNLKRIAFAGGVWRRENAHE